MSSIGVVGEISGVTLAYVTREVIGTIPYVYTKFDQNLKENVQKEGKIKDPVIIFFPNGNVQVLSTERAESLGYMEQPDILNLGSVQDSKTPAGRYKNAVRESDRLQAWLDMEMAVINRCISKTGHPLPLDCKYSENSIFFDKPVKEAA